MNKQFVDGIKDFVTQQNFSLEDGQPSEPVVFRAKLKAGVSTLTLTGWANIIWAVDRGLGSGVERNSTSGLPCGEFVTIFFWPNTSSIRATFQPGSATTAPTNTNNFLSQFETIFDPLPEWVKTPNNVRIDSPDFTAPNGIFDNGDVIPDFTTSTFKNGPKIYSERVMKELQQFPPGRPGLAVNPGVYAPFKNCPNIETISNQGTFGENLEVLYSCDFTVYDEDGFGNLSAYPSGGSPTTIWSFVQASKIRFSQSFPKFDTSRLVFCRNPFVINEIVIDTMGGPQLPFGGLDFSQAPPMELLTMDSNIKFTVNLPFQDEDSFTFSWGTLGITAPTSCKELTNIHKIFQNITSVGVETPILTPDVLKQKYHFSWGQALENFLQDSPPLTEDLMPLVPDNLEVITGFYEKQILQELRLDHTTTGFWASRVTLDGSPHNFTPQRIPEGVKIVHAYCAGLFAHQEVDTNIFIPSLPSSVEYARDAYKMTFFSTCGPLVTYPAGETEPIFLLAWSESSNNSGSSPVNLVANPTDSLNNRMTQKWLDKGAITVSRYNGNNHSLIENLTITNFAELFLLVNETSSQQVGDRTITSSITLEKNLSLDLLFSGSFQEDCFAKSTINPEVIDAFIPFESEKEWSSYRRALQLRNQVFYDSARSYYWKGRITVTPDNLWDPTTVIDFLLMRSYLDGEAPDLEPTIYSLDEVLFSGSPKAFGTNCIKPYSRTFDGSIIQGDYETFALTNNIFPDSSWQDMVDYSGGWGNNRGRASGWLGFNAKASFVSTEPPSQRHKKGLFGSYNPVEGRFGGEDLMPVPPEELPPGASNFLWLPLWVNPARLKGKGTQSFVINNQSNLDAAEASMNA